MQYPESPQDGSRYLKAFSDTVQTLHLRLLSLLALLQPLGVASLLAVEHESQNHDDVSHGRPHGQTDGLDHLVGGSVVGVIRVDMRRFF